MRLNGLDFHVELEGAGPPLVLLHGFTGSVRTWDGVRTALTDAYSVMAIDVIGHGRSAAPDLAGRYTFDWSTRDLSALLDALHLESAYFLGYSMGGRLALHFAVHAPARVRALILESASPGIEDAAERQRRVQADDALAQRIVDHGVPAFVEEWERQPLLTLAAHVAPEVRAQHHAQRLDNNPLGLANSLRGMGAGRQEPLWPRLSQLEVPVQLIVGALDSRYCAVGERMGELLPRATLAVVAQAGHTAHLDQPEVFVGLVKAALQPARAPATRQRQTN